MNKRKILFGVSSVCLSVMLASCGNSVGKEAIDQSKLSMASKDYEASLNYLELAKNEGSTDGEIDTMIAIIDNYLKAQKELESANIDGANEAIEAIPKNYTQYTISGDIENLKEAISKKQAIMADIDLQISGTKKMIADGDYESASANISELYSKDMTDYQKNQVDELNNTVKSAELKISEAEKKKPDVVYVTQKPSVSTNNNVVATYYVVNCQQSITLRTSPSTSASEITQIPLGQAVGYIENGGNGFYKINYDGVVGYALASYLSNTPSVTRTAQVVNAKESITLRSTPSTSASEITQIPVGAYVTYLGRAENGFYHIEYNGMYGYSLQSYIQIK